MIVLYNVADNVKGGESKVTTLTERADYSHLSAIAIDEKRILSRSCKLATRSLSLSAAGAERFATAAFATANEKLGAAERAPDRLERGT